VDDNDPFVVAGQRLRSRLLVGTGKFAAHHVMRDAVLASGTELVTVALRRVDLAGVAPCVAKRVTKPIRNREAPAPART
jgi:thiazole synthase ThiGH ThiG subunit